MAVPPNRTTNHSSPLPYLACLVPDVSMETQQKVRFISNSVLLPLDMTLAILSFLSNFLFLFAVGRIKFQQHPSLILFCSLSATDLIWAMFGLYSGIKKSLHAHLCPPKRNEEIFFTIFCVLATLSNLAVISKDRYRAVNRPLWYLGHVTRSRAIMEAIISWLTSVTSVLVIVLVEKFQPEIKIKTIISGPFCAACSLIIIVYNVGIVVTNRAHRKRMPQSGARHAAAALRREKKVAKTVGLMLIALVFTHLPALIAPNVLNVLGYYKNKAPFEPFFIIFITLNGLLNPLINFARNEAVRRSLLGLFGFQRHIRLVPRTAEGDVPVLRRTNAFA